MRCLNDYPVLGVHSVAEGGAVREQQEKNIEEWCICGREGASKILSSQ